MAFGPEQEARRPSWLRRLLCGCFISGEWKRDRDPAQPWKQLMAFGLKKTLGLPENHFLAISFLGMGSGKNIRRGVEV